MNTQKFITSISVTGSRVSIPLPFDPNEVWGKKQHHYVTGSVNGHIIRGALRSDGSSHFLLLGAAWRRDATINMNVPVTVELTPEGPQQDNLAEDIASALSSDPDSSEFFESLPTFYRKNYIRWIESAKRAETRSARIAEMMLLLKAKKREK